MAFDKGVSAKILETLKSDFISDQKNLLAQNICTRYDPLEICLKQCAAKGNNHVFNCKVSLVTLWSFLLDFTGFGKNVACTPRKCLFVLSRT